MPETSPPCAREEPEPVGVFAGVHVLAEFSGVDPERLDDEQLLLALLDSALTRANATVCQVVSKKFQPQGVTVLALLSESHASVHTYPERGSAFVDVFTCGTQADPVLAARLLAAGLGAECTSFQVVHRGAEEAGS
ncbi:adenosylmethionine decarboxylase [Kineococcus sp. NUM-3379]